ncbi:hypothetical protein V1498_17300 [Peribacillus sp. SCS-26]
MKKFPNKLSMAKSPQNPVFKELYLALTILINSDFSLLVIYVRV